MGFCRERGAGADLDRRRLFRQSGTGRLGIRALNLLIEPCAVTLHTDSKYVLDGITKWVSGWQRNGWKNASKQPVRNADLWHDLIEATARHKVQWIWVKGHNGHAENERADRLASDAADTVAAG